VKHSVKVLSCVDYLIVVVTLREAPMKGDTCVNVFGCGTVLFVSGPTHLEDAFLSFVKLMVCEI
jgi:hypothetical protein